MRKVEFFRHNIGEREIEDLKRVLDGLFLTTGKEVEAFEQELAAYLGAPHAVGVTSCTAAIHLALEALGVGPGDEVITTPMTFAATALAAIQAGATPVFVDVEPETGNMDVNLIENAITENTRAIVPVHLYGLMCDMKTMRQLADKYNLAVIEDAAHAPEASRDSVRVGELGEACCFSFYPTKSITCGEGGAISVHDCELDRKLRAMRHHGMDRTASERYQKDDVGYEISMMGWKYNMDNIQAALLRGQLEKIEEIYIQRSQRVQWYTEGLKNIEGIGIFNIPSNVRHAHHIFAIKVHADYRKKVCNALKENGIDYSINYHPPVHLHQYFREQYGYAEGDYPAAELFSRQVITLPLYAKLERDEVDYVVKTLHRAASDLKLPSLN